MLLKDFVNKKIASADKETNAEGVPLTLNNCKKYKKMRDLKVYGNSVQDTATYGTPSIDNPVEIESVGELVTDETDINYGKYKIPVVQRGKNLFREDVIPTSSLNRGLTCDYEGNGIFHIHGEYVNNTESTIYSDLAVCYLNIPLKQTNYTGYVKVLSSTGIHYMCPYFHTANATSSVVQWMNIDIRAPAVIGQTYKTIRYWNYNNSDASKISRFHIFTYLDAGKTVEVDMRIQVWLVEGNSGDVPFEPYVEPITTNIFLDEPLRKLSSYADYIDFKNNKVVRGVKEYNLAIADLNNDVYIGWKDVVGLRDAVGGGFNDAYTSAIANIGNGTYYSDQNTRIYICVNTLGATHAIIHFGWHALGMTEDEWKEAYPDLIVQILFPRTATTAEEPLDITLPKLNAKTTIIEVDTSILPSNISGKYILR